MLFLSGKEGGMKRSFPFHTRAVILLLGTLVLFAVAPAAAGEEPTPGGKNVILFSEPFRQAAERFRHLHRKYESVDSVLVSVEEIDKAESVPSARPDFDGWAKRKPTKVKIKGYNFDLALKIISYLEKRSRTEPISSVLILGTGGIVPPSYYFYVDYDPGDFIYGKYTKWIASDIFYGSPDLDLEYDWGVGRIAAKTNEQALRVAEKLIRWKKDGPEAFSDKTIYMGGNVTSDYRYLGEMYYLALQKARVFGDKPSIYFESGRKFSSKQALEVFARENASLMWIFSHGLGDGFAFSDGPLWAKEILALPYKKGLPLVLSPSCLDAGFDYDLIDLPYDQDGLSVGEAILQSKGAGIGYLGGSRINITGAEFYFEGDLLRFDKSGDMPDLLLGFLVAYHGGKRRIGDAFKASHTSYLKSNGVKGADELAMYVDFTLLGDPVLSLPPPPAFADRPFSGLTYLERHTYDDDGVPVFSSGIKSLTLRPKAPGETRKITLRVIDAVKRKVLVRSTELKSPGSYAFSPPGDSLYLVQAVSDGGRMVWQYFWVGPSKPLESL